MAAGVTLVGGGSGMQLVGKFGKILVSRDGGGVHSRLDMAINMIAMSAGLRSANPGVALAGALYGVIVKTSGKDPCKK